MNVWTAGEWHGDGVEQTEIKLKHNIYICFRLTLL